MRCSPSSTSAAPPASSPSSRREIPRDPPRSPPLEALRSSHTAGGEQATYAESRLKVSASRLRVWDAFVVRYDAAAQRSLPTHQDDSHLSLTIALNETGEYDGGGTSFEDLGGEGFVRPEKGCVVAFPGELRHGGRAVTRGVRYIIAVFLWVAEESP